MICVSSYYCNILLDKQESEQCCDMKQQLFINKLFADFLVYMLYHTLTPE